MAVINDLAFPVLDDLRVRQVRERIFDLVVVNVEKGGW
jgi:hypothetical protein